MRLPACLSFLIALAVLSAPPARAAPDAELWSLWTPFDPASTVSVDHAPWTAFIQRYRVTELRNSFSSPWR